MIHAVILAGGWGRRFWPKSRKNFPKQTLCIGTKRTPVQNLLSIISSYIPKQRIWVVANKEYAQILRRQLAGLPKNNFLIEPFSKNTAAAIGFASMVIKRIDPQAITVILSGDSLIGKKQRFLQVIKKASNLAQKKDALLTIGIPAHRPAQEYGYLKIVRSSEFIVRSSKIYKVEKFIEKPSLKKAKAFVKSKGYLWNTGIFVWKAADILQAIKRYLPGLYCGLQKIEKAKGALFNKARLTMEYKRFKDISIDYGVMEKARNVYAAVGEFSWRDLGSWNSLSGELFFKDKDGNIIQGLCKRVESRNSVILAEKGHLIATLGVRDLIVVHTPTATLVCKKDRAQDVKKLTQILEKDKHLKRYL